MKSLVSLAIAIVVTLACLAPAQAKWPWEKEKAKELTAWGWSKGCECTKGEPCTCGPDCQCAIGVGCKGRSGSQSTGDATYMVGMESVGAQQCFVNAQGQKQCFVNGVPVICDQPVQYAAAPASSWTFPTTADSDVCPCCGMKMTAEQIAKMKAKGGFIPPIGPNTNPVWSAVAPVTYTAPMMMGVGACADGSCGTAASYGGGRRGLFGRRRGGCGG